MGQKNIDHKVDLTQFCQESDKPSLLKSVRGGVGTPEVFYL